MSNESLCIIGRYLCSVPDPYKTVLANLLANDGFNGGPSADQLAKIMREAGLKASATAIRLHRAKTCVCS